jgi:hypothetical protein
MINLPSFFNSILDDSGPEMEVGVDPIVILSRQEIISEGKCTFRIRKSIVSIDMYIIGTLVIFE